MAGALITMAKKARDYSELSDKPLTPRENRKAREIMLTIDRMEWLGKLFLKIVAVVAATGAAVTVLKGWLTFKGA